MQAQATTLAPCLLHLAFTVHVLLWPITLAGVPDAAYSLELLKRTGQCCSCHGDWRCQQGTL